MKKIILGVAALLFAVGMFAQPIFPPAAPPPPPTNAINVPNNSPDPDANRGESIQTGNANKVHVLQIGTNQGVYTDQGDGAGSGGNLARVRQTGNVQPGISGELNQAEVYQRGTANQSTTFQGGDENEALTRQGQNVLSSSGNKAWIRQGTGQSESNAAGIDQDGDDNLARTIQSHDNNDAWTRQLGEENRSSINQNAAPNNTEGHGAEVDQDGDLNESWVNQSGNGARNVAVTVQLGNNNYGDQRQVNTALNGGARNAAFVSQGNGSIPTDLNATIWLAQLNAIDDIMNAGFNGPSEAAIAFQSQEGSGNDAEIHQFSLAPQGSNYAEQDVTGDNNDTYIIQNAYGTATGGANYAKQLQDGDNNQAGIGQNGSGHKAYQRQFGNGNIAMSTQRGQENCVNTYQEGDNNWANTGQRGQHNQILLVQKDGQSYTVTQNLADGMPNGGNWANILQLAPGSDPAAIDCVFDPQLVPQDPLTIPGFALAAPCPDC